MKYSQNFLSRLIRKYPNKSQRLLEILPGFVSWSLIVFPIWGSFLIPNIVAYYIIAFNVYWIWRSFTMAGLAVLAHYRLEASQKYDWIADVKQFSDWKKVHHLVVVPSYQTPLETLRRTLNALKTQTFPTKKIAVMISFEARETQAQEKAEQLQAEYAHCFGHLLVTFHPDIPKEVKGKSANMSWGAKEAKKFLVDQRRWDLNFLTITSEDDDTVLHPQYFAALAFHFLKNPDRYTTIWQAAIMFYNNIWRVPSPIRVIASMFSVFQLFVLMRPESLMNFSTYSTSLKLIDSIGYWDTDVIPEDYRLFFKSFFKTNGKLEVEPMFIPIYNDAAESSSFWKTMVNQYEQIKRWAWGVSDDAYVLKQWILIPNVPFWTKTFRVLHVIENHFLWPVNWFAITLGALLPPLLNPEFARTSLGKTLPQVSSGILTLSLLSLLILIIVDAKNRPPRPNQVSIIKKLLQPLEFLLLPVVGLFFSALPGLDAHSRLMLGKYIEYRVTEKV